MPLSENVDSVDSDALHILPLCILPLETTNLLRARLVKNVYLEGVVEFFKTDSGGSGQLQTHDLINEFEWSVTNPPRDFRMIQKLAQLPSYDVYSLRISLRDMGISIENSGNLNLSENKKKELAPYMKEFTLPLIKNIYGNGDINIQSFDDVISLFRKAEPRNAIIQLKLMSEKLKIEPLEIPTFLENYGDMFLSLAYYRECLDGLLPRIDDFLDSMKELKDNPEFKVDQNLMETINLIENKINERISSISNRFENFEKCTKHMWDNVSATRFRKVESLIPSYHLSMGGVLCGLSVKIDAWSQMFPNKKSSGPARKAAFILSEMKQGIDNLHDVKDDEAMNSLLNEIADGH